MFFMWKSRHVEHGDINNFNCDWSSKFDWGKVFIDTLKVFGRNLISCLYLEIRLNLFLMILFWDDCYFSSEQNYIILRCFNLVLFFLLSILYPCMSYFVCFDLYFEIPYIFWKCCAIFSFLLLNKFLCVDLFLRNKLFNVNIWKR